MCRLRRSGVDQGETPGERAYVRGAMATASGRHHQFGGDGVECRLISFIIAASGDVVEREFVRRKVAHEVRLSTWGVSRAPGPAVPALGGDCATPRL